MENKILKAIENLDKKFDKRFNTFENQTKENTQRLQALMHSVEELNAKQEGMNTVVMKIQGDVSGLRKDLSTMEVVTANNYADLAKLKAVR